MRKTKHKLKNLPAAKPTGHRTVRIVVFVVGDYFEVMTSKSKVTFFVEVTIYFPLSCFLTLIFLPGGIRSTLTKFLFRVGSVKINQDCQSSQSGGLVSPKGVVEGCGRKTLKIPTSVT